MTTNSSILVRYFRELRELLYLSGPILGAQLATTGMGFVDTSMAGQYSAEDLAAVAIGASIWIPAYLLIRGIIMATTPMVAHLYGAGQSKSIGSPVRQASWIALVLSLLGIVFLQNSGWILYLLDVPASLAERTSDYLTALSWGIPAICMYQVLACYCEGRSQTKPAMVFSLLALLVNIPLNYMLIYGNFGFPEMGGIGCGYATAVCFWLMFSLMFFYTRFSSQHKDSGIFDQWEMPNSQAIASHLKLGVPMGLAIFFEASIFSAVALIIGKLGAVTVAGHQVALNFSSITFMVPLSISMGITIRTGQALGAGKQEEAAFAGFSGIATTLLTASISASVMWFFPEWITSIYTNDPAVSSLAAELLFFAALFQFADGIQVASNGALRGYKDTRVPMILILVACWFVALPFGYLLGLTDIITEPMGPHGLWIGLVTALSLAALQLTIRFRIISRREIIKARAVNYQNQAAR